MNMNTNTTGADKMAPPAMIFSASLKRVQIIVSAPVVDNIMRNVVPPPLEDQIDGVIIVISARECDFPKSDSVGPNAARPGGRGGSRHAIVQETTGT